MFTQTKEKEFYFSYRQDFPFISSTTHECYMDSAASLQRPTQVLNPLYEKIKEGISNIGRSTHPWAQKWKDMYSESRYATKEFLHGLDGECIFTSGCTDASNILCKSLVNFCAHTKVQIVLTSGDHESFIQPWLSLATQFSHIVVKEIERDGYGNIDISQLEEISWTTPTFVLVSHIHNVSGRITDLSLIRKKIPESAFLIVDGAQSVSHVKVYLDQNNVDAFMFSGHKMFASYGIGALWVSQRLFTHMKRDKVGGGAARGVESFEPGTPNLEGALSLSLAIQYIYNLRSKRYEEYLELLTYQLYYGLQLIPNIRLRYDIRPHSLKSMIPLAAFSLSSIPSADAGDYLSEVGFFVRTGSMCTSIRSVNNDGLIRVSLHVYNTPEEIAQLLQVLELLSESYS